MRGCVVGDAVRVAVGLESHHIGSKTHGDGDGQGEDESGLLGDGLDEGGEEEDAALLPRHEPGEEGFVGRVGDHAVGPEHVDSHERQAGKDVAERIAEEPEAEKGCEQVGYESVEGVV